MRFYKLDRTEGGPLPESRFLKYGAIIRVPRSNSPKPGAQWNEQTQCWSIPVWVECDDPSTEGA